MGVPRDPVRSFAALFGLFGLLVLVLVLFGRLGVYSDRLPEAVLLGALALFSLVALAAHGRRPADFYVAGRSVRPVLGGLAGASGVIGLLAVGLAGGMFATASEMLVAAAGFLLGTVMLAFVAPQLARVGGTHLGDFLAARFGRWARLAGAAVAVASSLLLLVAVLKTAAPLVSVIVGLTPQQSLYITAALAAAAVLPGGMRSLTWTEAAQYLLTLLACLIPVGLMLVGNAAEGAARPLRTEDLQARFAEIALPFDSGDLFAFAVPTLLIAIGTASLPQMLARPLAATTPRTARASMLWCGALTAGLVGFGLLLGQGIIAASGQGAPAEATGDVLARAMPLVVALPPLLIGLVMAGLLAALLAAGQAALFSAATSLGRDVWDEVVDRRGPAGRRVLVARLLVVGTAYGAGWLAGRWDAEAPALLRWALALAAAGNFAPLVLGLFWRRCTPAAAACGTASGFSMAGFLLLLEVGPVPAWRDIATAAELGPTAATALGIATALLVSVAVSLLGPSPERDGRAHAAAGQGRRPDRLGERPA